MMETIAIAGSGAIGTGLAAAAAVDGDVTLWAHSRASARRARAAIDGLAARTEGLDGRRIQIVTDLESFWGATAIVEAISDDAHATTQLLRQLTALSGPDTLIATTTATLNVQTLASASGAPERFVGLHVRDLGTRAELIELTYAAETSDEIRARARSLCTTLGKPAVERPGASAARSVRASTLTSRPVHAQRRAG